ncbi:MAG: DUF1570 domain-containing protein [Planctomycetes bacterium]|nr:DUF1570 domain-containing protein [Planctomycetota bacterium]
MRLPILILIHLAVVVRSSIVRGLAVIALAAVASTLCGADDGFNASRAQLRKQRQAMQSGMDADRAARAKQAAATIEQLLAAAEKSRVRNQSEPLTHLVDGLELLDAGLAAPLRARVDALPAEPEKAPAPAQSAWDQLLKSKRDSLLQSTRKRTQDAINLGIADVAGRLMRQYLTFYPDDPVVHTNMGLTRYHDAWYGPRSLAIAKQGLAWDHEFGWILEKNRERYAKGDYYDLERKQWTTLEAADRDHADLAKPWTLLTEHLEIHGNAQLKDLVRCADRLEQFYEQIFASYALFFSSTGKNADLKLIFGMADHPYLVVNLERTKEDYQKALPVPAGWSDGMFVGSAKQSASYFYVGSEEAMYHEFTHQVLQVFTGTDRAPSWLVEGIAVYTQCPAFEHGAMVLGHPEKNQHIQHYFRQMREKTQLPLERLLLLESGAAWQAASDPLSNYAAAGAFVQFCMEGSDRAYRADFIDYLRDSYRGETKGHALPSYLGIPKQKLAEAFASWVQQQADPRSCPFICLHPPLDPADAGAIASALGPLRSDSYPRVRARR